MFFVVVVFGSYILFILSIGCVTIVTDRLKVSVLFDL